MARITWPGPIKSWYGYEVGTGTSATAGSLVIDSSGNVSTGAVQITDFRMLQSSGALHIECWNGSWNNLMIMEA